MKTTDPRNVKAILDQLEDQADKTREVRPHTARLLDKTIELIKQLQKKAEDRCPPL